MTIKASDIDLTIDHSTQFATAYHGDKPVASIACRRVYASGPKWTITGIDGKVIFTANYAVEFAAERIASKLAEHCNELNEAAAARDAIAPLKAGEPVKPRFVFLRMKMGVEIRCEAINGTFVFTHNGRLVHATTESMEIEVNRSAAFFTAWNAVTGHCPMTIVRRVNGRYVKQVESFIPANRKMVSIKGDWGKYRIQTAAF